MGRKQKKTQPARVVVAVRIGEASAAKFRAVAGANGKRLSDVLRDVLERAAKKAA